MARLIDRYAAALRDRRPFGAEIKVAIAPDSNINRATAEDRLETVLGDFTIDEPGRARSGIGVAVDGSAFGRLPVGESVTLLAQAGGRSVSYKDERFNRLTLVGRTGAQLSLGADRLSLTLAHQRHRLGGETALTTLGAEADWLHPLSSRMQGRLSASVARIDNRRNDLEDGDVVSLGGGLDLAFSPTAGLSLSISGSRRMASDPAYATRSVDAGIQGWHELGRFTFSASANAGWLRADERLALFPERRRDRSWGFGVGVTSRHFSWQGLAPSLRLTIERTDSSLAIYDTRRRAIELGLTRAF